MKTKNIFTIAILIALFVNFSSATLCRAEQNIINSISAWPKTTFMVQNFMRFIERANQNGKEQYPGELLIRYKGGPEVISFKEQVEAVRTGLVDMVFTSTSYYTSIIPAVDGFTASSLKPWEEREKGIYDFMRKIHAEKANAFMLSRMGSGIPFQIYLNKPVKSASDLKGIKLRCSPTLIPFLKKIGANPVVMKPGDVYTALERGVIEGFIWPAAQIKEWGWDSVTKYVLEPPLPYYAIDVVLINLDVWKKLPQHLKNLLIETAKEDEFHTIIRALEYIPRENANLRKSGIEFINLPENEAKKLNDAAISALWDAVIKRDPENGPKFKNMLSD